MPPESEFARAETGDSDRIKPRDLVVRYAPMDD